MSNHRAADFKDQPICVSDVVNGEEKLLAQALTFASGAALEAKS